MQIILDLLARGEGAIAGIDPRRKRIENFNINVRREINRHYRADQIGSKRRSDDTITSAERVPDNDRRSGIQRFNQRKNILTIA